MKHQPTHRRVEKCIFESRGPGGIKTYHVSVSQRVLDGGRIRRLCREGNAKNLQAARILRDELKAELRKLAKEGPSILLRDFIHQFIEYEKHRKRASSFVREVSLLNAHVLPALGHLPVNEISTDDIDAAIKHECGHQSGQSQKHMLACIRALLKLAKKKGLVKYNAADDAEKPKVERKDPLVLSLDQARTLLLFIRNTYPLLYLHVAFALYTGMRAGEIRALQWRDVDLNRKLISVTKSLDAKSSAKVGTTKTLKNRAVPINSELSGLLEELRTETFSALTDPVLPHWREFASGEQGKPLKEVLKALGLPLIRFHDLRATAITLMLSHNVPITTVMQIVGHKRLSSTAIYVRLAGIGVSGGTDGLSFNQTPSDTESAASLNQ